MSLSTYLAEISTCIGAEDGERLALLLAPAGPRANQLIREVQDTRVGRAHVPSFVRNSDLCRSLAR